MAKAGQIGRGQELEILVNMQWLCVNLHNIFNRLRFKKQYFNFEKKLCQVKKHKLYIIIFTTIHCVKPD